MSNIQKAITSIIIALTAVRHSQCGLFNDLVKAIDNEYYILTGKGKVSPELQALVGLVYSQQDEGKALGRIAISDSTPIENYVALVEFEFGKLNNLARKVLQQLKQENEKIS